MICSRKQIVFWRIGSLLLSHHRLPVFWLRKDEIYVSTYIFSILLFIFYLYLVSLLVIEPILMCFIWRLWIFARQDLGHWSYHLVHIIDLITLSILLVLLVQTLLMQPWILMFSSGKYLILFWISCCLFIE